MARCFSGALIYKLFDRHVRPAASSARSTRPGRLDQILGVKYETLAATCSALCIGLLFVLEGYVPWAPPTDAGSSVLAWRAWHPVVTGMLVGSLQVSRQLVICFANDLLKPKVQIPAVLVLRDTLGSATSYSAVLQGASHWQIPYVLCAILGARLGHGLYPGKDFVPGSALLSLRFARVPSLHILSALHICPARDTLF